MPGPARCESSSVARPMSAAVGTTPSADEKNTMIGSAPVRSSTIAIAMNGTSRYGQPEPLNRNRLKLVALASLTGAGAYPRASHGRAREARRAPHRWAPVVRAWPLSPAMPGRGGQARHA